MFTTSIQILHLLRIAGEEGLADATLGGLRRMLIASIGPTTTETLEEFGLQRTYAKPSEDGLPSERNCRASGRDFGT